MGVYNSTSPDYNGNCYWWLCSPGSIGNFAVNVGSCGNVYSYGYVNDNSSGVRVALNLNLKSSNLYTYAGTVCSDGTLGTTWESSTEKPSTEEPPVKKSQTINVTKSYKKHMVINHLN